MKISVVIPIYNGEKFIRDTINSVLQQPYNDFEILCIDDGSTDRSAKIVKEIENNDSRIKYIYKANGGVHTARNLGIELSTGDYTAFLDQDDLWAKNSITSDFVSKLKIKNCDFYKCSFYEINAKATKGKKFEVTDGNIIKKEIDQMLHHSSYLFKTCFLKNNNIFTDEFRCEDWRFLMRCYAYADNAECIDNPFFLYRNNFESVSHSGKSHKAIESALMVFLRYEKESDNEFVKKSCGVWAIGRVFELIDEIVVEKDAVNKIRFIVDKYELEYLLQNYWASDLNKQKFDLINSNINKYIKKEKMRKYRRNLIYKFLHIKVFINILEKVKYPCNIRELV